MINRVIDGMSRAIYAEFGDGYEVYARQDVAQGLAPPCFFIATVMPDIRHQLGHGYLLDAGFDVRYFPAGAGANGEMRAVGARLWDCLEVIALDDGTHLRARGAEHRIVDGVLHFMISYKGFMRREADVELMQAMDLTADVRTEEEHGKAEDG